MEALEEGLKALGLAYDDGILAKLNTYMDEIALFNPSLKLVSYKDRDELIVRHILDCAAGVPVIRAELGGRGRAADFGSGAGLPGIVLAILMPDVEFVLVERMSRRIGFLRNVVLRCSLGNVELWDDDIRKVSGNFPLVTFRAFRPITEVIRPVSSLLEEDGCICAYKAKKSYIDVEIREIEGFSCEIVDLSVPFLDEERRMLVMHKQGGFQ